MDDPFAININAVGAIAALVSALGIGAILKDGITSLLKWLSGMSARESKRKGDIVQEREDAVALADQEAKNRRKLEEALAEMRRRAIYEWNIPQDQLPPFPEYHTLTAEEVRRLRRGNA